MARAVHCAAYIWNSVVRSPQSSRRRNVSVAANGGIEVAQLAERWRAVSACVCAFCSTEPTQSGFVRGPMPTLHSAARAGSFKMQQYLDGFRDGAEFRAATIYYPEGAQPPFATIVFRPG
jgi:hypothetical protein